MRPHGALRKFANRAAIRLLHFIGYYVLLKRTDTRLIRVAGFELTITPTVYDPRYYRAPAYFAQFIGCLNLSGKTVADVGTGSGIQALAAARAGTTTREIKSNRCELKVKDFLARRLLTVSIARRQCNRGRAPADYEAYTIIIFTAPNLRRCHGSNPA